jgi:Zn-dependent metalloprotease
MGAGFPTLEIIDCEIGTSYTFIVVTSSSSPIDTGDAVVDAAHNYALATYKYYWNNFGRDSIDDNGLPLISRSTTT